MWGPIADDRRLLVEPCELMIDGNFACQTSHRRRDFGHGDQRANFEHFVASEHRDGTAFTSNLGKSDLAPVHSVLQASASVQNGSGVSGCRSYAARLLDALDGGEELSSIEFDQGVDEEMSRRCKDGRLPIAKRLLRPSPGEWRHPLVVVRGDDSSMKGPP